MGTTEDCLYKPLCWRKVRSAFKRLDPVLAAIIDDLDPNDKHFFYSIDYPFGSEIVKDGFLQLPTDKGLLSFPSLPAFFQKEFGYNAGSNPVTFVLKNICELFVVLPNRIVPFSIVHPGSLFGLTKIMNNNNEFYPEVKLWGMTSGARSLFLLPKITEHSSHQKLRKKLQLSMDKPQDLTDHWQIFKEITMQSNEIEKWNTTLLFFNKAWFEHFHDSSWMPFNYYIQQKMLDSSSYWRNDYLLRLLYSQIHHKYKINPQHYIADTVRYIIQICLGVLPGYIPATDDSCGPISKIQAIYKDIYNLTYAPVIMHPEYFSLQNASSLPVYASLQHNGALELSLKSSSKKTTLSDLYDIHLLLQKYQNTLKKQEIELSISALTSLGKNIQFKYFHGHVEQYLNIISTEKLTEFDPRFIEGFPDMPFPYKSHFLNGCIQITKS